ncbi:hypothetical protein DI09_11p230 [Mitosporidium daphniae]|uniref:CCT-beta n=1 Tax=Mitosporidium daphniae TaxID=1485682 RepID=A0A098VV49_9MICR|nr:uncharacterized protein DI09_11p230 [Mitosporidium daphniae]KGG52978.1 hypothetical protein DI09_11p230 [Mitosporidium daphniae]|eukprot:XP_013239405.1 uncharacterized protein DI09_11p230 [Mitosporidium daphniae]
MPTSLAPVQILQQEATEERAENARLNIFVGAIAVGDLVRNTLGPKGMDKILISARDNSMSVTNDGATILKSIHLENAAAKILVEISKVQDDEVGDGTTSVCILAAELLREAEKLISMKIHPQTIIEGYRAAAAVPRTCNLSYRNDPVLFRRDLVNIAKTTLSSKVLAAEKEYFAEMAVDAVLRLGDGDHVNLDMIQIIKKAGGRLRESFLSEGFIIDKRMIGPITKVAWLLFYLQITDARILVANTPLDTDKIKVFGSRMRVESSEALAALERAEREKMRLKIEVMKAMKINCIVNRQLIYSWPAQLLADAGIAVIEHADFDGVERLAFVTGAQIASYFGQAHNNADASASESEPASAMKALRLGSASVVEEILVGGERLTRFSGVKGADGHGACTIVLRGSSRQMLDEAERSMHDALCVLVQAVRHDTRTVLGAGCIEMHMSRAVDEIAAKTPGKQAFAIEAFSRALRMIPTILSENAGLDTPQLVSQLRAAHAANLSTFGLDLNQGRITDVSALGITESARLKRQVLSSATEAAEMVIRVDDIIKSAPRPRSERCQ